MLVTTPDAFLAAWQSLPDVPWGAAFPKAAMLMAPEGLSASASTCADNRYMARESVVESGQAHAEHRALAAALSSELPVWTFPGDSATPDATFLNNAFATVPGRLILGAMRYPERQRETQRADVRAFFRDVLGYGCFELRAEGSPDRVAELTGSLVIDRRRGVGFCGLGERCDLAGAQAMHHAFGLRLTFAFDLADGEYHTNVVMSVLGGRTVVLCQEGFRDEGVPAAIATAYGEQGIIITSEEKNAFAGNCIALREGRVWMSARADRALSSSTRTAFAARGWRIASVGLPQVERAGGSLRCCVAEVF